MTQKKKDYLNRISGALSIIAILSLWQDYLGQEAFIQMARDHWVDAAYSVPLALFLLLVSIAADIAGSSGEKT